MSEPRTDRRRVLLIHNRTAGRRRERFVAAVVRALGEAGSTVELAPTRDVAEARSAADAAGSGRFDVVAVAGGDGTINDVVNGLDFAQVPLAIIPCGTANVLARELALPRDPAALARVITHGAARPVRVGSAEGRRFVMMAGVGLDARAVEGVSLPLKRAVGRLAYAVSILGSVAAAPARAPYTVTIDGVEHRAAWAVVAKGRHYAGNFVIAPSVRLEDPHFEVCLCRHGGRFNAARYLGSLAVGLIGRNRDVHYVRASEVRIDGPPGAPVQGDGEIIARLPVDIRIDPHPLRVVVP